jgi:hypothetical protein
MYKLNRTIHINGHIHILDIYTYYTLVVYIYRINQKTHGTWAGSSEVTAQTSPSLPKVILPSGGSGENMGGFHGDRQPNSWMVYQCLSWKILNLDDL